MGACCGSAPPRPGRKKAEHAFPIGMRTHTHRQPYKRVESSTFTSTHINTEVLGNMNRTLTVSSSWSGLISSSVKDPHFLDSQVHSTMTVPPKIRVDFMSVWPPGLDLRPLNHSPAQTSHPCRCRPLPVSLKFVSSLHAHTLKIGLASKWQPVALVPPSHGLSLQ